MGVDYFVHVGPYIKVFNPEKDDFNEYNSCINMQCNNYHKKISGKFCCLCGKEITLLKVPCKTRIGDKFDVYGEFNDSLYHAYQYSDYEIYLPNHKILNRKHMFSPWDSLEIEISTGTENDEKEILETKYTKEIKRLEEVYPKVEVKWGVVAYSS